MDISIIPATIYFVGIAAVVAAPPESPVSRFVIFPNAATGSYGTTQLMPHEARLNLRKADLPAVPADYCDRIGGTESVMNRVPVCSVRLTGARLWTRTGQALVEDSSFRKMPSFLNFNKNAKNLPDEYNGVNVNADYVAARFDVTGGTLSGCNRTAQYIVTLNTTSEFELFVEQNDRTIRIVLGSGAQVAIENKPIPHTMTSSAGQTPAPPVRMSHFAWYYKMNGRRGLTTDPVVAPKLRVEGPQPCNMALMPIDVSVLSAAASAECSAINYP